MKKAILTLTLCVFGMLNAAFAQQDVYLKINHKLGNQAFALNTEASTPEGIKFNVSRLQYYISSIHLIHDGGQDTLIPNTWILVDANKATNVMLGNFPITTLEEIRISVGVEEAVNHLDPAQYDASHPLAPKMPSMHWGWVPGYRFAAIEGKGGASLSTPFEIHALGDKNYFQFKLKTAGVMDNGNLVAEVNADYEQCFKAIDVSRGIINHGEDNAAHVLLQNMNQHVFTSSEGNQSETGIEEVSVLEVKAFPNPSADKVTLNIEREEESELVVDVWSLSGKHIQSTGFRGSQFTLENLKKGYYFIRVSGEAMRSEMIRVVILK